MKLIREISHGGFGKVIEVERADGTRMAIKSFSPSAENLEGHDIEKLRRRFVREVETQRALAEAMPDYVIPVLDSDLTGDEPWFGMPVCQMNLFSEISSARLGKRVPSNALSDVLAGLQEIHRLSYIHRDLKPDNVLFHEGTWKLADYGLARPPTRSTSLLSGTASNWGTLHYCAPEQAQSFRQSTHLVDIYAFGCILHDIFVGADRAPYLRQSGPGSVGLIIEKCTDSNPKRRFQDVEGLRSALFSELSGLTPATLNSEASQWINDLEHVEQWNASTIESLLRFLSDCKPEDRSNIFAAIPMDAVLSVAQIDGELGECLVLMVCEWVFSLNFPFDYCDVLMDKLSRMFEIENLTTRTEVIVTAAELGAYHNRWYVMRQMIQLIGPSAPDLLAKRVAIEIRARRLKDKFVRCAAATNRPISVYHPAVCGALA